MSIAIDIDSDFPYVKITRGQWKKKNTKIPW